MYYYGSQFVTIDNSTLKLQALAIVKS